MAFTEVLLIKPVDGLGAEGEQVRVRAGFARNYLLPQGIALPVNRSNTKYVEALKKAREVRESRDLEVANGTAAKLAAIKLVFAVKTGEGGKMFGAISTALPCLASGAGSGRQAGGSRAITMGVCTRP